MAHNHFSIKPHLRVVYQDNNRFELKEAYGMQKGDTPDAEENDDALCTVCLTNPKNVLSIPCRHVSLCNECALQMMQSQHKKCPVCRQDILDIEIFKIV